MPFESIDHAGGMFLYKYLESLKGYVSISILAPASEANTFAMSNIPPWMRVILAPVLGRNSKRGLSARLQTALELAIDPLTPGKAESTAIVREFINNQLWREEDIIELQWSQYVDLAPLIRIHAPTIPIVGFEHDVYFQSVFRAFFQQKGITKTRLRALLQLSRVRSRECSVLNLCQLVRVFSKKDQVLLERAGVKTPIKVMTPFVGLPKRWTDCRLKSHMCMFLGAMARPENYEAVEWFLKRIWPIIKRSVPDARLLVVGSNPPKKLMEASTPDVTYSGYVSDLEPYFEQSRVFVAPLLRGAGVKFKVLEAMANGLPVVGTSVALEGIVDDYSGRPFFALANEPQRFATEVVELLLNDAKCSDYGYRAHQWISDSYDFQAAIESAVKDYYNIVGVKMKDNFS